MKIKSNRRGDMKQSKIEIIKEYEENIQKVKAKLKELEAEKEQLKADMLAESDPEKMEKLTRKMQNGVEKYHQLYIIMSEIKNELKKINNQI